MSTLPGRAPDIGEYRRGTCGIDYVHSFSADRPGPHVLLSALVHGNEPCGAITLQRLLDDGLRPDAGTLTLAFMNVEAYLRFDPLDPGASRYVDEDFNRLWDRATLDGPRDSVELRRARALRPLLDRVDLLLDLHSMQFATAALMLCGDRPRSWQLALALGYPRHLLCDSGHSAGRRLRDYGAFGAASGTRTALLIECGQHQAPGSAVVAMETSVRFLRHSGCLDATSAHALALRMGARADDATPQRSIEVLAAVTVASSHFHFVTDYVGMEVIPRAGSIIAYDGDRPVRTPCDECVLIMPSRRLLPGSTAVRLGRFV